MCFLPMELNGGGGETLWRKTWVIIEENYDEKFEYPSLGNNNNGKTLWEELGQEVENSKKFES